MAGLVKDWRTSPGKNPDDWLAKAPEFSRPICTGLREWIFRWAPDLDESIKWSALCFKGRKQILAIGAFKKHVSLVFFRGTELPDRAHLFNQRDEGNTSIRTIRITTLDGLNRPALRALIQSAVTLDAAPSIPPLPPAKRTPMPMPDFFKKALKANPKSAAGFAMLSPSHQREYIAWLTSAKRPETREKRLTEALAATAAGKNYSERRTI